MNRIDHRTVDLTTAELAARKYFEARLDEGDNIEKATLRTERWAIYQGIGPLDPDFLTYLRT